MHVRKNDKNIATLPVIDHGYHKTGIYMVFPFKPIIDMRYANMTRLSSYYKSLMDMVIMKMLGYEFDVINTGLKLKKVYAKSAKVNFILKPEDKSPEIWIEIIKQCNLIEKMHIIYHKGKSNLLAIIIDADRDYKSDNSADDLIKVYRC